jgi:hypothetical protein
MLLLTNFGLEDRNHRKLYAHVHIVENPSSHNLLFGIGCDGNSSCDECIDAHNEHAFTTTKPGGNQTADDNT